MLFNQTEKQEREYLRQLLCIVREILDVVDESVAGHVKTLQEYKDYLWSNKDIDPQEVRSMRESILNHFAIGGNVIARRGRLAKLLDIPYFGRIDFKENRQGSETMPIYIGIHTLYDTGRKINLIYDWRAPVATMFYENETGEASYRSPGGVVDGYLSLKRQYRIRKGLMEYMIESSVTIHDSLLQKELSANAGEKMKNIVATIQREQNRIIRDNESPVLIIQGVAGSGKTSVALHRIAYLLYTFKENITSKDILILSPNKVFADYISNVLPELGEETVPETGMEQILSGVLENKVRYQDFSAQENELLGKPQPGYTERIQYKASFGFIAQLDKFILFVENNYFKAVDVKVSKHITVPAEFTEEQFRRFHRYPVRQRFEPMAEYILGMMEVEYRVVATPAERNQLKTAIRNMFDGNDTLRLYQKFFEWAGKPEMFRMRRNRTIEYSDLAPLAYLQLALDGCKPQTRVKHLLIDEMQDYSPVQYKVIQKLYPCRKTILGDAFQAVNPYGSSTACMIQKALVAGSIMKLNKSYRSTCEITRFAQKIRANDELETVERHGEIPSVNIFESEEEEVAAISSLISAFRDSGCQSLAIICKDEAQAALLYEKLKSAHNDICFLSNQSSVFVNGIVVTSAHTAKGLEFDEVIVPRASRINYCTETDKSMLYVAVTRAMHRLSVTCTGQITGFIGQ